ncbi:ovalbumin-related protein X-like [Hydra vulgaris]|uniref:Ovalbumin-related protein X-like n=1 Tax=Hydra vulgaris TaxID=6087 RepID=A0ABM4BK79_HYDVU
MTHVSINQFTWELYDQIVKNMNATENLFFSPFSIYAALSIVYCGSRKNTADQMKSVMKCVGDPESVDVHSEFKMIFEKIANNHNNGVIVDVDNRIWVSNNFTIENEFCKILSTFYDAEIKNVDFVSNPQHAVYVINQWVDLKTHGKIKSVITNQDISVDTRMVVTNAVYFKALWKHAFKNQNTRRSSFHISKKSSVNVPMMYQQNNYKLCNDKEFDSHILTLPYKDDSLEMMIILPNKIDGLRALEKKLLPAEKFWNKLQMWRTSCEGNIDVYIPKFKFSTSRNMKSCLVALGIKDLFSESVSNLSGISSSNDLFVSNIFHKAFIDVEEEGTEAAAVTAVLIEASCTKPTFKADHPFLFLIYDASLQLILFTGRFCYP